VGQFGAVWYPESIMPWGKVVTCWGTFYAAWDGEGVSALLFPGTSPEGAFTTSSLLAELARQLDDYFQGERTYFDVPLSLRGTPFQLAVWQVLSEIPYGEVVTYGGLAHRIGRPRAARAVGGAVGANPVPIIIPCHRVLAARGLGGFGPGLHWKERLLRLEGVLSNTVGPIDLEGPHKIQNILRGATNPDLALPTEGTETIEQPTSTTKTQKHHGAFILEPKMMQPQSPPRTQRH